MRRIIEICLLLCGRNIESNIEKKVWSYNMISTPKDYCNSYHKFLLSVGYVRWKLASNHHDPQSYNKCFVLINIFYSMASRFCVPLRGTSKNAPVNCSTNYFWGAAYNSSVIRQKGESQNGGNRKTKHAKFCEKTNISNPLQGHIQSEFHTCWPVSMPKKCLQKAKS